MRLFRIALSVLLLPALSAIAWPQQNYQKGTIRKGNPSGQSCDVIDGNKGYQIGNCGNFQSGQAVDYRVKEKKLYIRVEQGNEAKCPIEAELSGILDANTPSTQTPKYQQGTIKGFEVRRDTHVSGGGGGGAGTPGTPVSAWTRHAKVYELVGADLVYKVDYCGAFQSGQFSPGQVVEYRVAGDRVYIRHDGDKEYSCQLEGTRHPDSSERSTKAESSSSSTAVSSAPASATAKLSVSSTPDGADIEVDGSFAGNTPSDLEIPEGQHAITVRKSGYKDWQRNLKVSPGSNVHLNAEMEKSGDPQQNQ